MNIRTFKLIVILSVSLFLFVFITRTVYVHNLPRVAVEFAVSDYIRHHHKAVGYVLMSESDEGVVVFHLTDTAEFVETGKVVTLSIESGQSIVGVVENVQFQYPHFEVYVSFESGAIQDGARVEAVFERTSPVYDRVLSNSAIREAWWRQPVTHIARTQGVHIVLVIEQERGMFGYIYSVRSLPITIVEQGLSQTAVQPSFPDNIQVVSGSSVPLLPGDRVRLSP